MPGDTLVKSIHIAESTEMKQLDATSSSTCYVYPSTYLVGGWTNPSEKYARQNGFIFPKFRDENNKYLSCHHLAIESHPKFTCWNSQVPAFCFSGGKPAEAFKLKSPRASVIR